MILQKMAQAIRRQDWFQVVIEVLIVIVGIFLGLQVNEWNLDRLEKQDELININAIKDEISGNVATLESLISNNDGYLESVNYLLKSTELAKEEIELAEIYEAMGYTFDLTMTTLGRSVFDEIDENGKLQKFRSLTLKTDIKAYYARLSQVNKIEQQSTMQNYILNYKPFILKHFNYQKGSKEWALNDVDFAPYEVDLPVSDLWSLPLSHPLKREFVNNLSQLYGDHFYARRQQIRLLQHSRDLILKLEAET